MTSSRQRYAKRLLDELLEAHRDFIQRGSMPPKQRDEIIRTYVAKRAKFTNYILGKID